MKRCITVRVALRGPSQPCLYISAACVRPHASKGFNEPALNALTEVKRQCMMEPLQNCPQKLDRLLAATRYI